MKQKKRDIQFQKALEKTNVKYGRSLKRLAEESAKLDPAVETALVEEGLDDDYKERARLSKDSMKS